MEKRIARLYSGELEGVDAKIVEIEADINVGLHAFNIVGLADKALNEAKERVNSALKNTGVKPPNRENRKITINLAPAAMRKTGSHYDLGIAIGYLLATKQITPFGTDDKLFLGELALDGRLRPVNGALNIAEQAAKRGFRFLFLPVENANEASVIENIKVVPAETIGDVIAILEMRKIGNVVLHHKKIVAASDALDLSEIRGQENAKRALSIALAGGHNILLVGPPGVGKSILARGAIGLLPPLGMNESIEVTKIWSAAGLTGDDLIRTPPFRAPHQSISSVALLGGGADPRPGEISLAHRGILFLDELPEFQRSTLESLRQPLEAGEVRIARMRQRLVLPAMFTLIAAMNPCPCGYYGDPSHECSCSAYEIIKYQKRISGPLLDRIDIQMKIGRVEMGEWDSETKELQTPALAQKIKKAREIQHERFSRKKESIKINARMDAREAREFIKIDEGARSFLGAIGKETLSPRAYFRLLKTARTIADLDCAARVSEEHLAEAFSYRPHGL